MSHRHIEHRAIVVASVASILAAVAFGVHVGPFEVAPPQVGRADPRPGPPASVATLRADASERSFTAESLPRRAAKSSRHELDVLRQLRSHMQREIARARLRIAKGHKPRGAASELRFRYELRLAGAQLQGVECGSWSFGPVPNGLSHDPWVRQHHFVVGDANDPVSVHWWPALDEAGRRQLADLHACVQVDDFNARSPQFRRRLLARRAADPDDPNWSRWVPVAAVADLATATIHLGAVR